MAVPGGSFRRMHDIEQKEKEKPPRRRPFTRSAAAAVAGFHRGLKEEEEVVEEGDDEVVEVTESEFLVDRGSREHRAGVRLKDSGRKMRDLNDLNGALKDCGDRKWNLGEGLGKRELDFSNLKRRIRSSGGSCSKRRKDFGKLELGPDKGEQNFAEGNGNSCNENDNSGKRKRSKANSGLMVCFSPHPYTFFIL